MKTTTLKIRKAFKNIDLLSDLYLELQENKYDVEFGSLDLDASGLQINLKDQTIRIIFEDPTN